LTLPEIDSLGALLAHQAEAGADQVAVRDGGGDFHYGELHEWSEEVAECLRDLGLARGARVALMLPNSAAYVAAFFGVAAAGGTIAPFNPRYREQEIDYYLEASGADVLVLSPDLTGMAGDVLGRMEKPPSLVVVTGDGRCDVRRRERGSSEAVQASGADAPLLHQYTSGSTGAPKRIVRTHGQLLWELGRLASTFELDPDDRFLGAAPFTHVNGLVRTMLTSMFVGGTLYPVPDFQRGRVLGLIGEERLTYFGGVPTMFALLAETRGHSDLGSLRVAFSSSAPLLPEHQRLFLEHYGVSIRQLYGSTETGTISVNRSERPEENPESVGLPLDGVRVEVLDEAGQPASDGSEGEVAIASPCAITAYDGNPEATATSFRDGLYLSGDLGRKDSDGQLTLTGRKKFMINRGGYKVNPLEVERAILSHPRVAAVVVLGAPSAHGDEVVRAVVVPNGDLDAEAVVEHCRPRIADFKIPAKVEFRDELPTSPTGKILRSQL